MDAAPRQTSGEYSSKGRTYAIQSVSLPLVPSSNDVILNDASLSVAFLLRFLRFERDVGL